MTEIGRLADCQLIAFSVNARQISEGGGRRFFNPLDDGELCGVVRIDGTGIVWSKESPPEVTKMLDPPGSGSKAAGNESS